MRILALDTSSTACSAALWIDGDVQQRLQLAPRRHAELILPMIEQLLAEAGIAAGHCDALAFGRGPGSFTGLRIAAGVAQGIAFAAELPVVPVSTLAAMAHGAMQEHHVEYVAAALDARMGEVYWGQYVADDQHAVHAVTADCVCPPDAVPVGELAAATGYGAGEGWAAYAETLRRRLPVAAVWSDYQPTAAAVASLAVAQFAAGETVAPEQAVPVYLRDKVVATAG